MYNQNYTETQKWYKRGFITGLIITIIFIIFYVILSNSIKPGDSWQGALIIIVGPLYLIWIIATIFAIKCLTMTIKARPNNRVQYLCASLGVILAISPIWISTSVSVAKSFWSSHFNPYYTAHTGNDMVEVPCSQDKISLTGSEPYIEDSIASALACRVEQFYIENHTWPSETKVYEMAITSYEDFTKNGYQIKINSEDGPDSTNFVLHYDTDCAGDAKLGWLSVFTPFYLNNHRKCVYSR